MRSLFNCFFFFNDTATTEIYTLSLHDALPICAFRIGDVGRGAQLLPENGTSKDHSVAARGPRSEEHTSELQSRLHLVCRLLLEKKKPPRDNQHLDLGIRVALLRSDHMQRTAVP